MVQVGRRRSQVGHKDRIGSTMDDEATESVRRAMRLARIEATTKEQPMRPSDTLLQHATPQEILPDVLK